MTPGPPAGVVGQAGIRQLAVQREDGGPGVKTHWPSGSVHPVRKQPLGSTCQLMAPAVSSKAGRPHGSVPVVTM